MFFSAGKTRDFSAPDVFAKHEVDELRWHAGARDSAEKRRVCNKRVRMSGQGIVPARCDAASAFKARPCVRRATVKSAVCVAPGHQATAVLKNRAIEVVPFVDQGDWAAKIMKSGGSHAKAL